MSGKLNGMDYFSVQRIDLSGVEVSACIHVEAMSAKHAAEVALGKL